MAATPVEARSSDWCRKKAIEMAADYFCSWRIFAGHKCFSKNNWPRRWTGRGLYRVKKAEFGKAGNEPFSKARRPNQPRTTWRGQP